MDHIQSSAMDRGALEDLKRRHEAKGGWQQRKSEFTQLQLLEATIRCIVRKGFAQVRTRDIAEEAGLSRGAIVHHFANKGQLFEKALVYVHERRLAQYRDAIGQLETIEERAEGGLDLYWRQLRSPYFIAAQELQMAARSDDALAAILKPQREVFLKEWEVETLKLFPEWSVTGPVFDLVMHITQFMMEGMAIDAWFSGDDAKQEQLMTYLKLRLRSLREAKEQPQSDAAVDAYLTLYSQNPSHCSLPPDRKTGR